LRIKGINPDFDKVFTREKTIELMKISPDLSSEEKGNE
jgi:hypothetical protein